MKVIAVALVALSFSMSQSLWACPACNTKIGQRMVVPAGQPVGAQPGMNALPPRPVAYDHVMPAAPFAATPLARPYYTSAYTPRPYGGYPMGGYGYGGYGYGGGCCGYSMPRPCCGAYMPMPMPMPAPTCGCGGYTASAPAYAPNDMVLVRKRMCRKTPSATSSSNCNGCGGSTASSDCYYVYEWRKRSSVVGLRQVPAPYPSQLPPVGGTIRLPAPVSYSAPMSYRSILPNIDGSYADSTTLRIPLRVPAY